MKVSFSPTALAALGEIHTYIAKDSPRAADEVVTYIEKLCLKLADFPGIGRPTGLEGIRVVPAVRYPYLIFYKVIEPGQEVRILRIRHGARKSLEPDEI